MKVKQTQQNIELLRVNDGFATLIESTNSYHLYEIRYHIKALDALKRNALIVKMSAVKSLTPNPPRVLSDDNIRNSSKLVAGLLTEAASKKDATRSATSESQTKKNSDITKFINNTTMTDARTTSSKTSIRVVNVIKKSDAQRKNSSEPTIQTMLFSHEDAPAESTSKRMSIDLLMKGIDPASAGSAFNCINGTYSTSLGVGHIARVIGETSNSLEQSSIEIKQSGLVTSLYDTTKQSLAEQDITTSVPVVSRVETEYSACVETLYIDASIFGSDDFFVTLELMSNDSVIQKITKLIDHSDNVLVYNTPKIPPYVGIAPNRQPGKNVLELQQFDETATAIRILRKSVDPARISMLRLDSSYEYVTDIAIKKSDGLMKTVDLVNNAGFVVYRCIPVGNDGTLCAEFSSVVATPVYHPNVTRKTKNLFASIFAKNAPTGIEITVADVFDGVFAVAIKRRNLTKHETAEEFITDDVKQTVNKLKTNTFLDVDVKDQNVYEYSCYLYFDDGTVEKSFNTAIIERFDYVTGVASVVVSDVSVLNDGEAVDVSFRVRSEFVKNDVDNIYAALRKQGYDDIFIDSLLKEREALQGLFAHDIKRLNLSTGECESFGTIVDENFVDSALIRARGVKKLIQGNTYRYVITTLLRSVESIFSNSEKASIDDATGNEYTFKPSKYRHPITKRGVLGTSATIKSSYAQDEFAFGYVGNSIDVDVHITRNLTTIESVSAQRINRLTSKVDWRVKGSGSDIDHFVILKEILGHMKIIGKSHSSSSGKLFTFFDNLSEDDIGEIRYSVVPVYLDYARGNSVTSNLVTIYDARTRV